MRTHNPVLNPTTFEAFGVARRDLAAEQCESGLMSILGTVQKTLFLLLLVVAASTLTWSRAYHAHPFVGMSWALGGLLLSLLPGLAICAAPARAPVLAPLYAIGQGLFVGGISACAEERHPGIVIQVVSGTLATVACLLIAYQLEVVKPTRKFTVAMCAAMSGISFIHLSSLLLWAFLGFPIPGIHQAGPIGIGFSLIVVSVAALSMVFHFNFIEQAAARGVPKFLEWYAAFALIVTIVWIYVSMLRLVSQLRIR